LPAISPADWQQLFAHGQWPKAENKTILGGLAGLLAAVFFYASLNRSHLQIFNVLAMALPAGMGIQRLSCLVSGCCTGISTQMPWGIRYDQGSEAWNSQVASGQIAKSDLCSLPVHPTHLYDILAWILIFFLAARIARRFHSPYARLILTIFLYGFFRFFLEFLRDPYHDLIPGLFGGIKFIQWIILAGMVFTIMVLSVTERWADRTHSQEVSDYEAFTKQLILNMVVISVFLLSWKFLNIPELAVMALIMGSLFIIQTIRGFRIMMAPDTVSG
jgi:phosphatidylglycerol:prolipoprotein diacylglycerol transferase